MSAAWPRLAAPAAVHRADVRLQMRAQGFTLVELLAALAIFAVIGILSLQAVSGALVHRAHVEAEARKWQELGQLFAVIEADLANALTAPGRSPTGTAGPAADGDAWLALARAGGEPADASATPPRGIVYRMAEGHVERSVEHGLSASGSGPSIVTSRFPSALRTLSVRYLTPEGEWIGQWTSADSGAPRALEITIETLAAERVRRIFLVG